MSESPVTFKPLARLSMQFFPDNNSSDYGHVSSAGLLQLDEQEGHVGTYLPVLSASRTLAWLPLDYQTNIHLVMAAIRL